MESSYRPRFACTPCRRLKKKCDRIEPRCTHCLRNRRRCVYSDASLNEIPARSSADVDSSLLSMDIIPLQINQNVNSFPAVYFLDSSLFERSLGQIPNSTSTIAGDLQAYVGSKASLRDHASEYFSTIHTWLPFISQKRFYERVLSPLVPTQADHVLLLVAIKLVTTSPSNPDPRSMIYRKIKLIITEIEIMGNLTLKILQALILVALYELGHAVYPSAYLTIGQCARYGIALGLNKTIAASVRSHQTLPIEEEERRMWWAIVILDRFVHMGCPERIPVTEEPNADSILPIDDEKWENEEIPAAIHTLSSPPTVEMGRFGLTVQAGILLGRVLRNLRDTTTTTHEYSPLDGIHDEEAQILERTISALANVSAGEAQTRGIGICGVTKICYSALLILNIRPTNVKRLKLGPVTTEELAKHKEANLYLASRILHCATLDDTLTCLGPREEISPFLFDAIYRSALVFMREYVLTGEKDLISKLYELKSSFEKLDQRWKAAGAYLQLLEAEDTTGILF